MAPTVVLIRHAQALHNQTNNYHDPDLTELGRNQSKELREKLVQSLPGQLDVGLILVSPMRRTIQTALIALDWLIEQGVPIQAHAGWQENSAKPCDTGTNIADLKKEFPSVDFSQVDPVYPDKTSPAGRHYAFTRAALLSRAQTCVEDLYDRPEKAVVVVSHSGFLRQAMTGTFFFNADYRIFDLKKDDAADKINLKQWQQTEENGGGMGWSWKEMVEIGDDLPAAEEEPSE